MTLKKTQTRRPACKHWSAFITIVLLLHHRPSKSKKLKLREPPADINQTDFQRQ